MLSLATLLLAAIPYCEDTNNIQECSRWMANDMVLEQTVNPGLDIGTYCEISVERLPDYFWRE
jgi:hypothetical protein